MDSLRRAPMVAILRAMQVMSDCSGIGNRHVVLEVMQIKARVPAWMRRVYMTGRIPMLVDGQFVAPGQMFIASIRPQRLPMEHRNCVHLPMRDGVVLKAIRIPSFSVGQQLLRSF